MCVQEYVTQSVAAVRAPHLLWRVFSRLKGALQREKCIDFEEETKLNQAR